MPGRWFRFCYHVSPRAHREPLPHELRDGDAALWLAPVLADLGYRYAEAILNCPAVRRDERRPVDESFLEPGDLLVVTTRPPIHDVVREASRADRRLRPSFTTLEEKIFRAFGRYFEWCARSQIVLAHSVVARNPRLHRRSHMRFRRYVEAFYLGYRASEHAAWYEPPLTERRTPVFLTYAPEAWPGGPGLLGAFGMGGTQTLVWARLLSKRYPHLVATSPFVMGDLVTLPLRSPLDDLRCTDDWTVDFLTEPVASSENS